MAGVPPADFGGDRVFPDDPQAAGVSTSVGDVASLNLQILHLLQDVIPDGAQGRLAAIAAQLRQTVAASDASQARELQTRELQPVTRVPVAAFGATQNIANIRMNNVPAFTGGGADTLDVVRWISRIFVLAQAHTLTFQATINLMIQGSNGGACDYIEQMREEGKTLSQVVQQLEMRYGDLCTPEEARVKTNNMVRKDKEGLPEFIDRLRTMARMACRLERDEGARRTAIDILVEGNIRRVLPTSVRNALEERVINRSRMGLPAFTAREIEKECLDLERRRNERKQEPEKPSAAKYKAHKVQEEFSDSTTDSDSSSDSAHEEGNEAELILAAELQQQRAKYINRGLRVDPQKVYKRAFKRYNAKYPPKFPARKPGREAQGARQAVGGPAPVLRGPPNKLSEGPFKNISELLILANCTKGQCIQCGFDGHCMRNDICVLKDKPPVDRPCAKCGKGLHQADDCPKAFQQRYSAEPQQAAGAHAVVKEEPSLNDD